MSPINDIPRRQMAHTEKQEQAKGLFVRGYKPPEVAEELSMNIRTVQRWFKLWKIEQGLIDPTTNVKPKPKPTAIVKAEVVEPHETVTSKQVDDSEQWRTELDAHNLQNRYIHNFCKLAWFDEFKQLVKTGKLAENHRQARDIRQGICTHSELETKTFRDGRRDELDLTYAIKFVESSGYRVIEDIAQVEVLNEVSTTQD